jgi:hypothetical protein
MWVWHLKGGEKISMLDKKIRIFLKEFGHVLRGHGVAHKSLLFSVLLLMMSSVFESKIME